MSMNPASILAVVVCSFSFVFGTTALYLNKMVSYQERHIQGIEQQQKAAERGMFAE